MNVLSKQFFINGIIIICFASINTIIALPEPAAKPIEKADHSWYETKTEETKQKPEEIRRDRYYSEFQELLEKTEPKTVAKAFETKKYSTDNWLSYLTSTAFKNKSPEMKLALFDAFIDHVSKNEFDAEKINKSLQYLDKITDNLNDAQKQKAYDSVTEKARTLRQKKHNENNNDIWTGSSKQELNNFYTLLSTAVKLGNEKNIAISKDQYDYIAKNIRIALNAENLARLPDDLQSFIVTTLKENLPSLIEKLLSNPTINKNAAKSLFISTMKNFDAALNGEMNKTTVQIATALIPTITKIIDKARINKNIKALVEAWDKEFASMKKKQPLQGKSFEEYVILLSGDKLPSTLSKLIMTYKTYADGEHSLAFYEELLAEPDITFDFATEALQFLIEEAKNSMGTKQQTLVKIIQDQLNSDKFKITNITESPENLEHYIKTIGQLFNNFVKVEGVLPAQGLKNLLLNNLKQVVTQPKDLDTQPQYQKALMSEPQSAATTLLATNFLLQNKAITPEDAAEIVTNLITANKMQPSELKSFQDIIKSNDTLRTFLPQLWTTTISSKTASEQQKRTLAKALAKIAPPIEKTKAYQEIIATEQKQPTAEEQQKAGEEKAKADRALEEAAMKEVEDKFTAAQLAKIDNAIKNPTTIQTLTPDELLVTLTRPSIATAIDQASIAINAPLITAIIDRYNSIDSPTKLLTEKYDLFTGTVKKSLDATLDNIAKINPDQVNNLLNLLKKFTESIQPFEVNTITPLLKKLINNQTITLTNKVEILRSVKFSKELLTNKDFVQDLFGPLYKAEMIDVAAFKELAKLATEFKGQVTEQYMQLMIDFIKKNMGQLEANQIANLIDSVISLGQLPTIVEKFASMAMAQPDINSFIKKLPQTITRPAVIDRLLEQANAGQISSDDSLKVITVALNNNGNLSKSLTALMRLNIKPTESLINLIKTKISQAGMFNEETFFKNYSNQLENLSAKQINNLDIIMTAAGNQKTLIKALVDQAVQKKWSLGTLELKTKDNVGLRANIIASLPREKLGILGGKVTILQAIEQLYIEDKDKTISTNAGLKKQLTETELSLLNQYSAEDYKTMPQGTVEALRGLTAKIASRIDPNSPTQYTNSLDTLAKIHAATQARLNELSTGLLTRFLNLFRSFNYEEILKNASRQAKQSATNIINDIAKDISTWSQTYNDWKIDTTDVREIQQRLNKIAQQA